MHPHNGDDRLAKQTMPYEKSLMYRKNMPKELRRYLEEMAVTSWHSRGMYNLYRKAGNRHLAILTLAAREAAMTFNDYGPDHPDADPIHRLKTRGIEIPKEYHQFAEKLRWAALRIVKGDSPDKETV